jgi:sugar phosphate isomerase/epimerase
LFREDIDPKPDEPLFRISLAQWSLHRALNAGELDTLDFVRVTREHYGLDAVEYVNSFFKDKAEDEGYLRELEMRAADNGIMSLLIMCDGEGALGDPDDAARTVAVENHYRWVSAAKYLGCHSIRVNARSEGTPETQHDYAVDGLSSNGAWLAGVIEAVGSPRCGTLPDFGNFQVEEGVWYDRYKGVAELMPFARAVSAKSNDFDDQGDETRTDYARMMRIVLDAGYHGFVGIEYEGRELSEDAGIRLTKALLERTREALADEYR